METVNHINIGQKYRIVVERAAVKGVDGFKVEANGDDKQEVESDIQSLYTYIQSIIKEVT